MCVCEGGGGVEVGSVRVCLCVCACLRASESVTEGGREREREGGGWGGGEKGFASLALVLARGLICYYAFDYPLFIVVKTSTSACCGRGMKPGPITPFTFHPGSAHPLQDVALHQCLTLPFCLLLSCSRGFTPSLLWRLVIFCLVIL